MKTIEVRMKTLKVGEKVFTMQYLKLGQYSTEHTVVTGPDGRVYVWRCRLTDTRAILQGLHTYGGITSEEWDDFWEDIAEPRQCNHEWADYGFPDLWCKSCRAKKNRLTGEVYNEIRE